MQQLRAHGEGRRAHGRGAGRLGVGCGLLLVFANSRYVGEWGGGVGHCNQLCSRPCSFFGNAVQESLADTRRDQINMGAALTTGKKVKWGPFSLKIKKPLGEGGFGYVYLVKDKHSGKRYALKRVLCQDAQALQVGEVGFGERRGQGVCARCGC